MKKTATSKKPRAYTIRLDGDIVDFVREHMNVDGVAPAVRAALRKMMKEATRKG